MPAKYHYQVFHAISFFENEFNVGADFLRSQKVPNGSTNVDSTKKPEFQLTAEQARIAHHKLSTTEQDIIKIIAFAGKVNVHNNLTIPNVFAIFAKKEIFNFQVLEKLPRLSKCAKITLT